MIAALAFVPPFDIEDAVDELAFEIRNRFNMKQTMSCIIWKTRMSFPEQIMLLWHRGSQAKVSAFHPTFWKFLDVLKKEETILRVMIFQNQGCHRPPPQRRRYADCNQRIFANTGRISHRSTILPNIYG